MKNTDRLRNLAEWAARLDPPNGQKVADELRSIADDYEYMARLLNDDRLAR